MTRLQLSLNAERLRKRRLFGKGNPYAVVKVTGGPMEGTVLGSTESVENCLDPDWVKILFIEAEASTYVPITVTIYDDKTNDQHPDRDKIMAEATFEVTEVFQSPGNMKEVIYRNGSRIYAHVEESIKGDTRGTFHLQLRGLDMKNVEPGFLGLGRSDPFFEIHKKNADHAAGVVKWNAVIRSKHIEDNLNPYWDPTSISLEELCYCDVNWPLRLVVFDFEDNGNHRAIGFVETTVTELMQRKAKRGNADRNEAIDVFKEGTDVTRGYVIVLEARLETE